MKRFFKILVVAYFPSLLVLSFFPKTSDSGTLYALNLLFFFLYSFPFYCVFLEICETVISYSEKREKNRSQRILHAIRMALSVGILLTLIDVSNHLYLAITMATAWLGFRILEAILFREDRQSDKDTLDWRFWISVLAVVLVVGCALLTLRWAMDRKNSPDPLEGGGTSEIIGNTVYFYDGGETAIHTFSSDSNEEREIKLSAERTYRIEIRPISKGSKDAVYFGNCAMFHFEDGCCEIIYVGEKEDRPIYELKIDTDSDFDLTVEVDGFRQTVRIQVQ